MRRYEDMAEDLKALAHPLRMAILSCVADGHQEPVVIWRHLTAREPDLQLALVSYHVQRLVQAGLISLMRTQKAGNMTRHFYTLSARGRKLKEVLDL